MHLRRFIGVIWSLMLLSACEQPETAVQWQAFTAVNNVRDVALWSDRLAAATDGGVAFWDAQNGVLEQVWTVVDGLPHTMTRALTVCEAERPLLFAGSERGVGQLDAERQTWRTLLPDALPAMPVVDLVCHDDVLLIGYETAVARVALAAQQVRWIPLDTEAQTAVRAVGYAPQEESIWVAHDKGISVIRDDTLAFYAAGSTLDDPETPALDETIARAILTAPDGVVWLGTVAGLTRVAPDGAITFIRGRTVRDWPFFQRVDSLTLADDGALWTNSAFGGICQFDAEARVCRQTFDDEPGMAASFNNQLVVGENGRLYFGAFGSGISAYNGAEWQNWRADTALAAAAHRALTQDARDVIWLGGHEGGVRWQPDAGQSVWQPIDALPDGAGVNAFFEMPQGMWVAHDAGASFFSFEREEWAHLSSSNFPGAGLAGGRILAIAQDNNNHLWFGSAAGLTVWDGRTFTYVDLLTEEQRAAGEAPRYVQDLAWDGTRMWVGTNRELLRIDAEDGIRLLSAAELGLPAETEEMVVYALLWQDGRLHVAVNEHIVTYTPQTGFRLTHTASQSVRALSAARGTAWAGLQNDQLLVFTGSDWVSAAEVLADGIDFGRTVVQDAAGDLWIAGGRGGGVLRLRR